MIAYRIGIKKNHNWLIFSSINLTILSQVDKLISVSICIQEGFLPASLCLCQIVFGEYWGKK